MIFTLVGLSLLWLAGFQVTRLLSSALNAEINVWMQAGTGFFIASALLILWLTSASFSLSTASWSAVGISTLISLPLLLQLPQPNPGRMLSDFNRAQLIAYSPYVLILALIFTHVFFVLANNLTRDIYPWDAFTTWMYRAKVWVLNDNMVNFQDVKQWLQLGGQGYALRAAHYPSSISAIAAFASTLSGGWSDQLASVPWGFATLAISGMMYGLCRQYQLSVLASLVGCYLLTSIPLVGIHGMLAGYADLWMSGTSGMGLASLLVWTQKQHRGALLGGAVLLSVGTSLKMEGWLWLGLGAAFVVLVTLWRRYRWGALFFLAVILTLGINLESINLGPLGLWGIQEDTFHVGPLGQYALRPFNALPSYREMIFMRGNFHLLGVLYLLGLGFLTFHNWRDSLTHWLMGGLIVASQWVIFGLSSYSLYAETGTAINRLLLHFVPVFVLTIVVAWQAATRALNLQAPLAGSSAKTTVARYALTTTVLLMSFAAPAGILLDWCQNKASNQEFSYTPDLLEPALGQLARLDTGKVAFTDTPGPVAVAKVRLKNPGTPQPRYVISDASISAPGVASFYWINKDDPQVNAYSLDMSGPTILDMKSIAAFWQKPVTEMGYLVDKQSLSSVQLDTLAVSNTIRPQFVPALVNHWLTPNSISQRTINMVDGHAPSPINWTGWASAAALFGTLLAVIIAASARFRFELFTFVIPLFLALLWLVSDMLFLRHAQATFWPLLVNNTNGADWHMNTGMGEQLPKLAELITANTSVAEGVVSVSLDPSSDFQAQKLPLILAPQPAASVSLAHANNLARTWQGHLILFSRNKALLLKEATRLSAHTPLQITEKGDDYIFLTMEHR